VLNRTFFYASMRRPIRLPFKMRVAMRIIPISMLAWQAWHMMYAMRCQTSVNFQGGAGEGADVLFHAIGRAGSFWFDDRAVCEAIGMIPDAEWIDTASTAQDPEEKVQPPKGSLDTLWPLYKTLSLSQFVEVFCCSLVGRIPVAETGMTLLEHSLAFAEAEKQATRKTYRLETTGATHSTEGEGEGEDEGEGAGGEEVKDTKKDVKIFKIKGEKLVPSEVLYISIISAMSHITSHVLAIFNLQTRYRLLATGFYGMAFLSGFAVALYYGGATGILNFPTVSVVGFIPHLLIFAAISGCGAIYGLALMVSSLFPPSGRRSFSEGFNNLRANHTISTTVTVSLGEDFYTVLLKFGYVCLTAAAEATYLNEGRAVRVPAITWLEGERQKLLDQRNRGDAAGQFAATGKGGGPFAMERRDFSGVVESVKDSRRPMGGRWIGAGELLRGVVAVVGRWGVFAIARLLYRTTTDEADNTLSFSDVEETEDEDYAPSGDDSTSYSSSSGDEDEDFGRYSREQSLEPHRPTREATPLLGPLHLAALLDPQCPEDRASARLLARHLAAPAPLTRRQYSATQLSGIAEEAALENILLHRRGEVSSAETDTDAGGPLCVVCQSEPRTIIVWPCRCLNLCEDCRVCLAMNNWSSCVTCRGKCMGYSRVYVP